MKKFLLLSLIAIWGVISLEVNAQTRKITGRVTSSEDGEGLPGVTVAVKGTPIGTVTDVNGSYSINVPENAKSLAFSFLGMKPKEVSIASESFNVIMDPDAKGLDAVVVTALGIERDRKSLGYSATQLDGGKLEKARETNLVQSMAGKIAGVQINGGGGTPGASSKIIIRGNKTFGNNQPLFIVDGIPIDNSTRATDARDNPFNANLEQVNYSNRAVDLNPEDIENMTVLRGPSAAALYGIRAANGAVIITTKKSRYGQKINVTVSSNVTYDQVNKLPELQNKYAQGNGGGRPTGTPTYVTYGPGPNGIYEDGGGDDVRGTANSWGPAISTLGNGFGPYDNIGEFFQTGVKYENNVAVSAGSDKNSARFSYGNLTQTGVIPNTEFNRNNFKVSTKSQLGDYVSLDGNVNYANSNATRAQQGSNLSGVMLSLLRTPASFNLADGFEYPNGNNRTYLFNYDNPYWTVNNNPYRDNTNRVIGNLELNIYPTSWLKLTARPGTDFFTTRSKQIYAIGSNNSVRSKSGEIRENVDFYQELNSDLIAIANKEITENFGATVTVGNNFNQRFSKNLFSRSAQLALPKFYNLGNGSDRYTDEATSRIRTAAVYGVLDLNFKQMLFVSFIGRNEWASTFGPNRRSFFFPSANLSFVFTELAFLDGIKDILSYGKLRLSSATGANIPPPYASVNTYDVPFFTDGFTDGFSFPFLGQAGYGKSRTLGNPGLKPEFNTENEFGFEFRLFKDRVSFDMNIYESNSVEVLLPRPVSYSSGFSAIYDNGIELKNSGYEITLGITPVRTKSFSWDIDANYSRNKNEVVGLIQGIDQVEIEVGFGDPGVFAKIGQPFGTLYGTKWVRNANGELIIDDATGLPTTTSTLEPLGNPYPDYMAGIRNTFTFKGISLSGLIDIRQGGVTWNGTQARLNRIGISKITEDRERTYVIEGVKASDGSKNDIEVDAIDYFQSYLGDFGATEQSIQDISWIRLRDVTLSYVWKKPFSYVSSIEFTASGRNLLLFTDYTGVDPESSLTGAGSNYGGVDWFVMPNTKSYSFGVRFNIM